MILITTCGEALLYCTYHDKNVSNISIDYCYNNSKTQISTKVRDITKV